MKMQLQWQVCSIESILMAIFNYNTFKALRYTILTKLGVALLQFPTLAITV